MAVKVGFIGLGRMGLPMAVNVAKAGFDLMVYDLREEPLREMAGLGAKVGNCARAIAERSEIVEVAVVDDSQVEAVVLGENGMLEAASAGAVIAIHSTIRPKTAKKISEVAELRGVKVLDAQISGGERGASEQSLCYMVGGDKEALERCRALFSTSAANILHMGDVGMGAMTKAIQQVVVCINMLAASEGFLLGEKAGVDLNRLKQAIHVSAGQSYAFDNWLERFKNVAEPLHVKRQRVEVFRKSLSPALDLAYDVGISLPGAMLAHQLMARMLGLDEQ